MFQGEKYRNILSFLALRNYCLLNILPSLCSVILVKWVTRRFPTPVFQSMYRLSAKFSMSTFLIMCPRKSNCLYLIYKYESLCFPFYLNLLWDMKEEHETIKLSPYISQIVAACQQSTKLLFSVNIGSCTPLKFFFFFFGEQPLN